MYMVMTSFYNFQQEFMVYLKKLANNNKLCFIMFSLKVHYILNELVMGGMVLETNMSEILSRIEDQTKMEKEEVCMYLNY